MPPERTTLKVSDIAVENCGRYHLRIVEAGNADRLYRPYPTSDVENCKTSNTMMHICFKDLESITQI